MDGDRTFGRPARVFVGRSVELATLRAALAAARGGEPQVVLIQGEAGIGKSWLVSEFLDGQRGVPVVAASGEETEAFLPYGVVQQLAAGAAAVSAGRWPAWSCSRGVRVRTRIRWAWAWSCWPCSLPCRSARRSPW